MTIFRVPKQISHGFSKIVYGVTLGSTAILLGCSPAPEANKTEATPANTTTTDTKTVDTDKQSQEKVIVYTSTNVWGAVAKAVGGEHIEVIAGVNEPTQDPHDYQATANDKLNISKAKLVLVNGGGYDDWTTTLAKSVQPVPKIINAVELSGIKMPEENHDHHHDDHHHDHAGHDHKHHVDFNEHVFFSLDTAKKVAEAVANHLASTDPNNQATYVQNAKDFMQHIDKLKEKAKTVGAGKQFTVFSTEPVVGYLLADMGVKNVTPDAFIEQSETETGVSVKVLTESQNIIQNKQASVLVLNAQTEDASAKKLLETAKQANVPVVEVFETLPPNVTTYIGFMEKTIDDFTNAINNSNNK